MFTMIRPISALVLGIFALYAAQAYVPFYDPQADLGSFPLWAAGMSFVVGWSFLGGRIGRAVWVSVFAALQAVVLAAIGTAAFLAIGEIFTRGYRQQYDGVVETITGYFDIVVDWLSRGLVQEYLIILGTGGVVIGVILHVIWSFLEQRRNDR